MRLSLLFLLAACRTPPFPEAEVTPLPDLSVPDLSVPDLAAPDLAARDLAAPDLWAPDLTTPVDLAEGELPPGLVRVAGQLGGAGYLDGAGSEARFREPIGIAADDSGILYVADLQNQAVRRVDSATGEVTLLAGRAAGVPESSWKGLPVAPLGITLDKKGRLFVSDWGSYQVLQVDRTSGAVTVVGRGFLRPAGLVSDGDDTLYVADSNSSIYRVTISSGAVTTLAGKAGSPGYADGVDARFTAPFGVALDGAGHLFVSEDDRGVIRRITLATGEVMTVVGKSDSVGLTDGVGTDARLASPGGLACDGKILYLADRGALRQISLTDFTVSTMVGPPSGVADGPKGVGQVWSPAAVALGGTRQLYFVDTEATTVRGYSLDTGAITTLAGRAAAMPDDAIVGPLAVAADGPKTLYVADNSLIRRVDLPSGRLTFVAGAPLPGILHTPSSLGADGAGHLYMLDGASLRCVDLAGGTLTTLAGVPEEPGYSDGPGATARFSPGGSLALVGDSIYFTDPWGPGFLRRYSLPLGTVSTVSFAAGADGGVADRLNRPRALAFDGADTLYIADERGSLHAFSLSTSRLRGVAFADKTQALAWMGALYRATDRGVVERVDLAGGTTQVVIGQRDFHGVRAGQLPGLLNRPNGLAPLGDHRLALIDNAESAVLVASDVP